MRSMIRGGYSKVPHHRIEKPFLFHSSRAGHLEARKLHEQLCKALALHSNKVRVAPLPQKRHAPTSRSVSEKNFRNASFKFVFN